MNKKTLNLIFILSAAGLLLLASVLALTKKPEPVPEGPVLIEEAVEPPADIVSIRAADPTPAPTEAALSSPGAVTLLVDRRPVLTLLGYNEAENLLHAYLRACAVAPEGETFVSATFASELILTPAETGAAATDYESARALLVASPSIVPVKLTTIRTETTSADPETKETKEPALPAGCRIIVQLGSAAATETATEITYVAGAEFAVGAPKTRVLHEARASIVKAGTYTKKDTAGEPDKDEGPEGKSKGSLTLAWPMRGSVVSHFGYRDGRMHNGVDVKNDAGAAVTAPGEGVVVYCGERGAYGFVVDIDHGNGFVSRLTHLADVSVERNQRVFSGDKIGVLAAAEQGKPHLHYELIIDGIPYNPEYYL